MHPEIARSIAGQRADELRGQVRSHRLAARQRGLGRRPVGSGRPVVSRLWAVVRPVTRRLSAVWPSRSAQSGEEVALPGVFTAGPEAFGLRTYLTPAEARQLAADWTKLLSAFADRMDDPSRRPPGAVPFEVVVLGRQVPDLVGAAHGLPGPPD
jgi:hypothetical protein